MRNPAPLAVVTGASSGIGLELAKIAVDEGYDLIIAADEPEIEDAAETLRATGASVDAMIVDLSDVEGVRKFFAFIAGKNRPVDILLAGLGLGKGFLDQELEAALHVVNTNVIGTLALIHSIGNEMRARGEGRILITGRLRDLSPVPIRHSATVPKPSLTVFLSHCVKSSRIRA